MITLTMPIRARNARDAVLGRLAVAAGRLVNRARRSMPMWPGIAGAACISIGLGEVTGHIFGRGLAPWVALLAAGVFALWLGSEVNRPPPAPRDDNAQSY